MIRAGNVPPAPGFGYTRVPLSQEDSLLLDRVSITGFRSIREKQDLHIDQFVTVLIGANDHGKTNLLEAVRALNDDYELRATDRNWDTTDSDAPRLEWTFELTPAETEELGQKAERLQADQESKKAAETDQTEDETADESEVKSTATTAKSPSAAKGQATDDEGDAEAVLAAPPITAEVIDAIKSLRTFKFVRAGVKAEVSVQLPASLSDQPFISKFLLKLRPRVELFKGTTKILDSITLAELEQPQNEFMQGIFRKAEVWDDRSTLFEINPRTQKRLADASQVLTNRIREEWQQGQDLMFILGHAGNEGNKINLSIQDPSVQRQYVQPTQRSTGFSAFFGMNMALFARKEASPANNYIFIFDEPATALHPHGQVNVQRVFETFSRKNQITYTTHSIFMVNKNYPPRNRAVTKNERGTLIDHKPYIGNWKAVRSNLGLIFSNNFFVADSTLLVEGPSDEVYVASLLRTCDRLRVIDVDLNLFSIHDAGNSADMVAMAKLMADEGRRVIVMVDGDTAGANTKKRIEQLNANVLKDGPKIEVIALLKNKSIEDLVVYPDLLRDAVNKAAHELVDGNIRKFKDGLDLGTLRESLDPAFKSQKDTTLGRALNEITKTWFDGDEEPISKLHVARIYDELVEALPAEALKPNKAELERGRELASDIHKRLRLSEKIAAETIVE